MRILDKYILKELAGPFIFGIASFSSIFIASSVLFRIAQYLTKYGASVTSLTKLFVYSLPEIINFTFPMSMLLASLLAFGRLSASSEITAMKSGGISFLRLSTPVFLVAFCVSIFSVVFAEKVVPASKLAYSRVLYYEIEQNTKPRSQEHIILKSITGGDIERLTYARKFDEHEGKMQGVTVEMFEKGELVSVQKAEEAVWDTDKWIMKEGMVYELSKEEGITRTAKFEEQIMPINTRPNDVALEQKKPDQMTIKELKQQIGILKRQFLSVSKYEMEMYQRVTIPMASLVFAVIGTPLGLQPQRSSSSIGLGLSIIIIFIYYTIMTLTTAIGQGGVISPFLAAWVPNIVGLLVGAYLIRRVSR